MKAIKSTDTLRNEIITSLLAINDRARLNSISKRIKDEKPESSVVKLSKEQKLMLQLSEQI